MSSATSLHSLFASASHAIAAAQKPSMLHSGITMIKLGIHQKVHSKQLTQRDILVDVGCQVSLKVSQLGHAGILNCLAYRTSRHMLHRLESKQGARQLCVPCTFPETCLATCACRQSASRLRPALMVEQKLSISPLQSPAATDSFL